MTDFPKIDGAYAQIKETSKRATVRSPFEAGYEQTRSKWTRAVKEWEITWNALSTTDLNTLQTFYETTMESGASRFVWHRPDSSGTTYMVRFTEDEMKFISSRKGYWRGTITIRQI